MVIKPTYLYGLRNSESISIGRKHLSFDRNKHHTFGSQSLSRGEPLNKVRRVLGNENSKITEESYEHMISEDIRETINSVASPV
jgi:hypothetical protein